MAVKLDTARQTFLKAVQYFPRWMSIRKRPDKAVSGLHLASIIDEQTDIVTELNKFIKEFFLITYVGKESDIVDYVYITQVGSIDVSQSEMVTPAIGLTADPRFWLENQDLYALYQEGYIIISAINLPENESLVYTYNGYKYGGKLQRYHIWNIFDEFAMFLGLERFTESGETNAELLKRCFLVFQNPANSTVKGLQNTIMNCISNDITVEREDIKIEVPNSENMWLADEEYGTIYERLTQLNRDIYRAKSWDIDNWEHNFKQLEYLPHRWDKELEVYQDGTGQMGDLSVTLSQDEEDTTNVTVKGFKKDRAAINEYFHKQNIRGTIDLKLKQYSNVLKPQRVQYKITATPAIRIVPENIFIREQTLVTGTHSFHLQDIVTNAGSVEVTNPGLLTTGKTYELVFTASEDYSDMQIRKLNLVSDSGETNLLTENRLFKFQDGILRYADVLRHITSVNGMKNYVGIVDVDDGVSLSKGVLEGSFTVDVTGCAGRNLRIDSYGEMHDVTEQIDLWTFSGLKINSNKELYSDSRVVSDESATLELDCMGYSYTLKKSDYQGSVVVKVWVNGKANSSLSGLLSEPDVPVVHRFDRMSHVKIVFTKSGEYPFALENVMATKYEINYSLTYGTINQGSKTMVISDDIPKTRQNTLTVTVKNYDVTSPVIRYVHVGPSVAKANYTVRNIVATPGSYLDVDTDCKMSLYEVTGGARNLISNDYSTVKYYTNRSVDDVAYLEINTNSFTQVTSSSKRISKTARNGNIVSYITLAPGERLSMLTITGTMYRDRARRSVKELMGWEDRYNIYVAKNAKGFIVRDSQSGEEWQAFIPKSVFTDANTFTYEGLPEGTVGFFYVNRSKDVVTIANSTDRNFEDTFVGVQNSNEYVAYNEIDMYKSSYGDTENIVISNTFTPIIDMNQLLFYCISDIYNVNNLTAIATFKKFRYSRNNYYGIPYEARERVREVITMAENNTLRSEIIAKLQELNKIYGINIEYSDSLVARLNELLGEGYWSLGQKELFITTGFDFGNSNSYGVAVNSISQMFSISNEIALNRHMTLGESEVDIAQYIIEPPSNMTVIYGETEETVEQAENLIVNEDGFNKLKYSNIANIQAVYVDGREYNNYTVLKEEGIIVWNDVREIAGLFFAVAYEYRIPTGLRYNDLSYLYDMVSYTVDAYIPVEVVSRIPENLEDGDSFIVEFRDPVDYVPQPECTNSNFIATYNNNMVTVQRLYTDNVAIVQAGYYYDNAKEYYYYNHDFYDTVDSFSNVVLHNVKKLDVMFIFMMASANYLPGTAFKDSANYEKLCYVDFDDPRVESSGISRLDIITACESYNSWRSFNMAVTFVDGINGIGMLFRPDDTVAYAVLNLTKYLTPGCLVSMFATNGIELEIYQEIKAGTDSLRKSVFAQPYDKFTLFDNFYGWEAPADIDLSYQYFLVVRGTGVIDDIIVRDGEWIGNQFNLHMKNVDVIDFNIDEFEVSGHQQSLTFDPDGCNLDGLEIARDNTIQIGSNVDYGLTKIWEMQDEYDNCMASTSVARTKGTFITGDTRGWVKTPLFYVENNTSVAEVLVKINNLLMDKTKYFNVTAFVSDEPDGLSRNVGLVQKTNLATFNGSQLSSYMQFQIDMERNRLIDSVEVYARYAEGDRGNLRIENHYSGSITTKIYDTGAENSYKLVKINGVIEHKDYFRLSIRGCKQDATNIVWTDWYQVQLNNDLEVTGYPHVFEGYRLFQFKIDFNSSHVTAKIDDFVLEVV